MLTKDFFVIKKALPVNKKNRLKFQFLKDFQNIVAFFFNEL